MNLHVLVSQLISDTEGSVARFLPELAICATIIAMLLVRVSPLRRFVSSFAILIVGVLVALAFTGPWTGVDRQEIFSGMLVYDGFTVFLRTILLLFVLLFAIYTRLSGLPDREDGADIYTLVLGATLGMCVMASANHLLTVFLGVEMASVPSYALAAMLKGRRQSSEAAIKYAVYGAGAAGVMLYGISLIAGSLNTLHFPTLALQLAERLGDMSSEQAMVLALGGMLLGVGLAFKLSAVPFHFWCPDVFEGATAEVNAFLSIASKAAALALLIRVVAGFGTLPPDSPATAKLELEARTQIAASQSNATSDGEFHLVSAAQETPATEAKPAEDAKPAAESSPASEAAPAAEKPAEAAEAAPAAPTGKLAEEEIRRYARQIAVDRLAPVRGFAGKLIAFLAVLTCTFGNLAAYGQTNIKRLFAYSTIAHAGYMMMAVPAFLVMAGYDSPAASRAVAGVGVYLFVYLFMNLAAFAIIAFWRNAYRTERIEDYAGLIRRSPITTVCFCLVLFSLVGLPPLAGFIGKFAVFAPLVDGYRISSEAGHPAPYLLVVLLVGGINTAISLFYYLRVAKVMTIDPEPRDRRPGEFTNPWLQATYVCALTLPLVLLIVGWEWLHEWSLSAARQILG
ncbi:MAG: NADH-quinone oxidoreductase subunit N [Pirellulales bacterium]